MRITVLFILISLCVFGCRNNSTTVQPTVPSSTPTDNNDDEGDGDSPHQFGEFSFAIPHGWTVVTPVRDKTKAMILLDGTNWQNAKAMIKVDVGTPAAPTAEELAQGFAKNVGGTVSPEPMDFNGTPGINASTSSTELTTPRNMIVIYRDSKAFLLMAGAVEGIELTDAIAHIRETWMWAN